MIYIVNTYARLLIYGLLLRSWRRFVRLGFSQGREEPDKHGVSFEEAATVFADPLFILVDASRNEETRDAAIGFDSSGRLLYVVHIEIEVTFIRIISARRTGPEEEKHYAY